MFIGTVAITGYNRTPSPRPYWKVRWAFGTNYGLSGSMLVEKINGSTDSNGPCDI
jgi:hypothetical protein